MRWGKAGFPAVFLLIISGLLILIIGDRLYYRMFSFLVSVVIISGIWSRFSLHGIDIKRYCRNQRLQIGQLLEEKYEITNHSALLKPWLEIQDGSNLPHSAGSRVLTFIGPFQKRNYVCYTYLSKRGMYTLSPIAVRSGDIFGIFKMEKTIETKERILVTPFVFPINLGLEPRGSLPGGKAIKTKSALTSPYASGVREYQSGDALNHIHWRTSLRNEKLMVKEFDQDPQANVWIIIDANKASQYTRKNIETTPKNWIFEARNLGYKPESSMDYLSSIGASYAKHYIDEGKAVGLLSSDSSFITLPAERGERQYLKLLDHLAMIKGIGEVPIQELVTFQSRYLPSGGLVIIISSGSDQELVICSLELQSRGIQTIVILLDPINLGFETKIKMIKDQLDGHGITNTLIGEIRQIQEIQDHLVKRSFEYNTHWVA